MRQVDPMLVELRLQLVDHPGQLAALGDQARDDVILARGHVALLCQ
jgi:hypothetical protein